MKAGKIPAIAVLLLSFFILPDCVQAKYSGGSGEPNNPYQIGSAVDLLELAADANDYNKPFVLIADINLASYSFTTAVIAPDTNPSNTNFDGTAFTGVFDGNNHTISNLTIDTNGAGNDYLGLFGYASGGEIKNLGIEDINIAAGDGAFYLGGLVGDNRSTISNCYSTGAVTGTSYLGGLVGASDGNISSCYSTATVTGQNGSWYLGGLVGWNDSGGNIGNCHSTGKTSGGDSSQWLGGLVGYHYGSTISNCYSTGTVTGGTGSSRLGGLVGFNYNGSISNCYSTGAVEGGDNSYALGGLVGHNKHNISNCCSTGNVSGGSGSAFLGGLVGYNLGSISNSYSTGKTSGGDNSGYLGGLMGYNDGSISSNCYSTGKTSGGVNSYYLGGLAGWNYSSISNCYSSSDVNSGDTSNSLGGLVGWSHGSINNCYATGTVTGGDNSFIVGGLVGTNYVSNISNCYTTGNVSGKSNLGGLVGVNYDNGSISDCYSTGHVTGEANSIALGGLVGTNYGDISNCCSTGKTSGGDNSYQLGGLAGYNNGGNISNCYATGGVNSGDDSNALGGLMGANTDGGDANNCYSTGAVRGGSGSTNLGGLVGDNNSGTISSCYFPVTEPNNGFGTPLTKAKMKHQSSFIGWDFVDETANGTDDIWWIAEGTSYPKLYWQTVNGTDDIWWIAGGTSYPKLYWQLDITKCTVTAGSKVNSDKISFSGTMGAKADDFNDANNVIKVTIYSDDIVSPCDLTFPIDANTFKKGKYNYSGTDSNVTKSFTYDTKTHKFAFSASKLNLSGLGCLVTVKIDINDFNVTAGLDETIVNGSRVPIPIKLMNGVKNVLRVDKCTVKQNNKPNKDQLTASGAFAVENPDPCMANWITEGLVITLGSQQFDIHKNSLKAGKGMFSCSKAKTTDPNATAAATFNFNLCSFILTIKDANIPVISGDVDFGAAFADYDEIEQVTFP